MTIWFDAARRMSENEYRLQRARLRATYGDTGSERTGLYDQSLARLFHLSGWTQEQLAHEEAKTRQWVAYRLRYGAFLTFATTVAIPKNLTEGRFRSYWQRTSGTNDRQRFQDVARLMENETTLSQSHRQKKSIGAAIKSTSADGNWHRLATIVTNVQSVVTEATEADVLAVLKGMVQHGWYNVFCEKKKGGQAYRIVIGGKQKIDLVVLKHELSPIVEALKAEGKKNMATMSPGTVAHLTFQLERLLDKLAHQAQAPVQEE